MKVGSRKVLYTAAVRGNYGVMNWEVKKKTEEDWERSLERRGIVRGRYSGKHRNNNHDIRKGLASKVRHMGKKEIEKQLNEEF